MDRLQAELERRLSKSQTNAHSECYSIMRLRMNFISFRLEVFVQCLASLRKAISAVLSLSVAQILLTLATSVWVDFYFWRGDIKVTQVTCASMV
jgi:hypothetical protein